MFYKQSDDLYPKTLAGIAALTLDQWLNDEDANPILVTMRKQQRHHSQSTAGRSTHYGLGRNLQGAFYRIRLFS